MAGRSQFTFYRSYYDAIKKLPQKEQTGVLLAICGYALDGEEPQHLSAVGEAVMALIRPTLDASRRKAESGSKGGSSKKGDKSKQEANGSKRKQNESKQEANGSEKEKENEKENEIEIENENENECYNADDVLHDHDPEFAKAFRAYMDRINPTPSPACMDELKIYVEEMGADVVITAIDTALDERKTSWSYIRAILRNYLSAGVRCVADVQRLRDERDRAKDASQRGQRPQASTGGNGFRNTSPSGVDRILDMMQRGDFDDE